jgi:RNA polymerase primary sigma factor
MPSSGAVQARSKPWWRSSTRASAPQGRTGDNCDKRARAAEMALVVRAKRGGPREREPLIESFLPMIASVARTYRRSAVVDQQELTQEGFVGLLRALETFDPDRGVPFWAYATWWVREAMQHLVSELSGPVVLSDRAQRRLAQIREAQRRFEQTHRRSASSSEIARILGLSTPQVESLLCAERSAWGLDEPAARRETGDSSPLSQLLADPRAREAYERVADRLLADDVPNLLEHLTERERMVVCARYGIGTPEHMLREIAAILGVSAERARQIEQASLAKLRAAL